ncbi:MAG: hypothetical protein GWN07_37700, partial [Actinobacteria bacterium]|nr:hypothetical protein [Actinomycetota bacterium]
MGRALELLGYELREPGDPLAEPFPSPLPADVRDSVGTFLDGEGVERLIRIGGVQNDTDPADPQKQFWAVRANDTTLTDDTDFRDIVLNAG